tara:strand:- start:98 stop:289 length:192 start_codon:yes stop_codon:yes gene_type:complete
MGKEFLNNQKITALSEAWGIKMHDKTIEAFTERQSFMVEPSALDLYDLDDVQPIVSILWNIEK